MANVSKSQYYEFRHNIMNLGNQNNKYSWRIRDLENPQTGTQFANSVLMYKITSVKPLQVFKFMKQNKYDALYHARFNINTYLKNNGTKIFNFTSSLLPMFRDVATAGGGGRQSPALRFRAHH